MAKTVALKSMLAIAGVAVTLSAASAVQAQSASRAPQIEFVPVAEAPQPPAGLKVTCVSAPTDGAPSSNSCPVINYGPGKTWVYSYIDNRVSFALVTYDATGKVLQNIEKPGARYVFDVYVGNRNSTLVIVGQAKGSVEVNWSDLPH